MNVLKSVMLAAALFAPSAFAQKTVTVDEIAAETGLTHRQVAMVLGAPTAYAEYRTNFRRARDQFLRTVGQERYAEYLAMYRAGELKLDNG
jgi:hypothetical protein